MSTLPVNLEAERTVIGTCLMAPGSLAKVSAFLTPSDFYHPAWSAVYEALCSLALRGKPADITHVVEELRSLGLLEKLRSVGGSDGLVEVMGSVVTTESVEHHARIVARKAHRRRIVMAAQEVLGQARDENVDDDSVLAQARDLATALLAPGGSERGPGRARYFLRDVLAELGVRVEIAKGGRVPGIPTAFSRIDGLLGGLFVGEVLVLGARPGMGKTSMLMGTCINAARSGHPSLIFSKEMRGTLLWERALSGEARVPNTRLRRGVLEVSHMADLQRAAASLAELPIWMDDDGDMTIEDMRSRALRWRAEVGDSPAIIGVDYVQLIRSKSKKIRSREEEVAEISAGLKAMAKDLKVSVIALASLNREVEKRDDKRPKVSDLRDSGAIESDADVVAMMYRDEVYNRRSEAKGVAEFIVGKNRNGPVGLVRLKWEGEFTRFEDLPRPKERELDEQEDD